MLILGFSKSDSTSFPPKNKTAFGADFNTNLVIENFTEVQLESWSENYDEGNAFNPMTGEYIAPADGIYLFTSKISLRSDEVDIESAPTILRFRVNKEEQIIQKFDRVTLLSNYGEDTTLSTQIKLKKDDVVTLHITVISGGPTTRIFSNGSSGDGFFTGVLLE